MSANYEETDLRELAERFAKDFGISYDKISIKEKTGWVSYKTDTGGSGGWTEGIPAVTIRSWMIIKHYQLFSNISIQSREDRMHKNKSLCGCPMCKFHVEAYELTDDKQDGGE